MCRLSRTVINRHIRLNHRSANLDAVPRAAELAQANIRRIPLPHRRISKRKGRRRKRELMQSLKTVTAGQGDMDIIYIGDK